MTQKNALITGASSGIGLETARILAQNNFNLIITGRRAERLEKLKKELAQTGVEVLSLVFDVRIKNEVDHALASLPAPWRHIDVLINNAGLAAGMEPIFAANADDWEQMIDTNVKGLLYVTRTVSAWMVEQQYGHIINISSIAGKEAYPNGSVYCGTKHAVSAISKAMRIELSQHNVKVGSICPGAVDTEFSTVRFKGDSQRAANVYKGFTPLYAKDIAETIWFMVSRPASVNIDDILIMPTAQASARDIVRK
ncbi:MAG: SDR family NAD(P)-dependent oxidoreductase [Mangrovibacterium sp.]